MKIFDCILFFNELEILDLRLMTLNEVVDYFVLVEANKTFTGNTKEFVFENNRNLYEDYLNKIIHIKVEDTPPLDRSKDVWTIEKFQRNSITRGLLNANDKDRIIISDVDEIPDPEIISRVKESRRTLTFNQRFFYYYVNCMSNRTWNGSVITSFFNVRTQSPQTLRDRARHHGVNRIQKSGWHYTYMGGVGKIRTKLNNLSDTHIKIDQVGTNEDIAIKMSSQQDLWNDGKHRLINIKEDGYSQK